MFHQLVTNVTEILHKCMLSRQSWCLYPHIYMYLHAGEVLINQSYQTHTVSQAHIFSRSSFIQHTPTTCVKCSPRLQCARQTLKHNKLFVDCNTRKLLKKTKNSLLLAGKLLIKVSLHYLQEWNPKLHGRGEYFYINDTERRHIWRLAQVRLNRVINKYNIHPQHNRWISYSCEHTALYVLYFL